MNNTFLLIGGNMGDVKTNLDNAIRSISKNCGQVITVSSIYQTAAWGKTDQPDFLNQAIQLLTPLEPVELLHQLLQIERDMGRERAEKYGPRSIDIDIIFYEQYILDLRELTIPHPQVVNRRFALTPLAEIAPTFIHPVLGKTIEALLISCPDSSHVNKKKKKV
ncbi:MAG: 2-amino-4-hydroxy-6-hydroxymethyldihydropteridine diphosphokinase [Bacteroidota bacterium]